ncbi:ATP11 protein-domain-containing protein [Hyaloraphidium curvatum]|nr:ATP11 protein-domain-containing protein [Hyaloraphidium curvatum]
MKNGGEFPMVSTVCRFGRADKRLAGSLPSAEVADSVSFPLIQFILPLPRDKGFEFFLLQFQPPQQILFTSLHAYQTLGPSCRPYLTLTLYPDLLDAKGIALMRGEVDAEVLGKQMGVEEARMLALYMQAYYVEPNERKKELLRTFHQEPAKFNYQDVLDEIEKLV